ncbi:MAG: pyridoxamine 5'-phosphate oxidase family protein, partial [Gemmatimonadetes bacterium]|nr:pyridoxamine 5'-phosphate oxidase family protein [Gemmatimonadota bacterium]
ISRDRGKIHELYRPDWRAWFGDEGGERNGGPDDPRIALVLVEVDSVIYMKSDTPTPVVLFQVVKGIVTGTPPKTGEVREVSGSELHGGRAGNG